MGYSSIAQRFGNCSQCNATDVPVSKIGKNTICHQCNKSNKAKKQLQKQKEVSSIRSLIGDKSNSGGAELQRWFEARRREMSGVCMNCGGKTQKYADNYKNSVAHLLPKAYFKSVATHPLNWIELCFYGDSCHTNFDNKMLDITELNCFDEVIKRFVAMYPSIAQEERQRIPNILLQYIEVEK